MTVGMAKAIIGSGREKRRFQRVRAVLSVWVTLRAEDGSTKHEIAHTLDFTGGGIRLGAVRHPIRLQELITVAYRQRRMQFRVVWIMLLKGTNEYHVGLESVGNISQMWGLRLPEMSISLSAK